MRLIPVLLLAAVALAEGALEVPWSAKEETSTMLTIERTATATGDALAGSAATITKRTIVYGEKVDEVLDGHRTKVRRKYARYETETRTIFGDEETGKDSQKHPIAGKVLSFVRRDGRLVPTKEVPKHGLGGETPFLAAEWETMLAGKVVKKGDAWTTTRTGTFAAVTKVHGASMKCTLESLDKGRATVKLALDHKVGKNHAVFKGSMTVAGGRVVEIELTGTVSLENETIEYKITGKRRGKRK